MSLSLKEPVVRPPLKKPSLDQAEFANYRPISSLPYLGKLIERAVETRLQGFLDDASVLDPFQSGFRPGHGTETVLVTLTDDLRRHLDRGGPSALLLLDLSAAFDKADHQLLTHCLADAGIQGLSWFLQGRGQRAALGEQLSRRLDGGVPQGVVLSPMLFNIYMCPLAQFGPMHGLGCHRYMDDTQLYLLSGGQSTLVREIWTWRWEPWLVGLD